MRLRSTPPPINRVPRIERPAVRSDVETITALLDDLLSAVVARLAQRLKRPEPKLIHVTVVRLNMIADGSRLDNAARCAKSTKRLH